MDRFDWLELERVEQQDPPQPAKAPTDGPSFYAAARRMRMSGHFGAAAQFYERAIGFDDHNYGARVELVDTLVRAGRLDLADRFSHASLDAYRKVRILYAARALALTHRGDIEKALSLVQVALDEGRPWYALCVRAETLLRSSATHRGEALVLLEEAADKTKSPWDMYFTGGCILIDAGWPALAAGYFSEAAHHQPGAVISWICLGDCFQELKLFDQALFYYEKAAELEPAHEVALQRRRTCTPFLYGLTRVFRRESLHQRWNRAFDELRAEWHPTTDDY